MLNFSLKVLKNKKNINITIKPHPKINIEKINKIICEQTESSTIPNNIKLVTEDSIYSIFNKNDFFITTYSSTGVEAIAFDLPVIVLLSNEVPEMSLYFGQNDIALKSGNEIELMNHLDKLISDESFRENYLHNLKRVFSESFYIKESTTERFKSVFLNE